MLTEKSILRDIETINLELIFSDLEILERRIAKAAKAAVNDKSLKKELEASFLKRLAAESAGSINPYKTEEISFVINKEKIIVVD